MTVSEDNNFIKLCETLQQDYKNLISETRRKYPSIKESGENVQKLLKELIVRKTDISKELISKSATIVQPLLQGCNTQLPKAVSISLTALQRLSTYQILTEEASAALIGVLWGLMESGIEEVKLLQTTILLITTNDIVKGQNLARGLGLCFRLHDSKNSASANTAAATLRQCISAIMDRMLNEHKFANKSDITDSSIAHDDDIDYEGLRSNPRQPPASIQGYARDVFMLFQDLCLLINKDPTIWLQGLNGVNQTLGLELLELIIVDYSPIFIASKEFTYLLKEKVCPLIIKLFSPSLKFKPGLMSISSSNSTLAPGNNNSEKSNFPLVCRLIRLITVIIKNYFFVLNTECEIFMSLVIRFLDTEKPLWQRALALEVIHKCVVEPSLVKHICENYDMKENSTKIFGDLVSALSSFIQSCFINQPLTQSHSGGIVNNSTIITAAAALNSSTIISSSNNSTANVINSNNVPVFFYRGLAIPVNMNLKIIYYELLDKSDPPPPPDGYSLSLGFISLIEIVKSIQVIVEEVNLDNKDKNQANMLNKCVLETCWVGLLSSLSLLLESSTDELSTEALLRTLRSMISMCGEIKFTSARDAFVATICKASLPPKLANSVVYNKTYLNNDSIVNGLSSGDEDLTSKLSVYPSNGDTNPNFSGLIDKNIQCVRSLLNVAHCHGNLLGSSWNIVLTTLQHTVSLLGLTVTSMGSIVMSSSSSVSGTGITSSGSSSSAVTSNTVNSVVSSNNSGTANNPADNLIVSGIGFVCNNQLSTAVIADLPVLSAMLSRLFECSQMMDESSLTDLIKALCQLTKNATIDQVQKHKEPSLFSIAKLMETGLSNIKRPKIWWTPIMKSLLNTCQQPNTALRQLAADAIITLVKDVIKSDKINENTEFWSDKDLYSLVLDPLSQIGFIKYGDLRQKQLDCVQYLIHRYGDQIDYSWYLIVEIIGNIQAAPCEQLVRLAFHCFQLVNTDYMSALNFECYPIIIKVASTFAKQEQDLNISLSAIGSIWYIADYLYQQNDSINQRYQALMTQNVINDRLLSPDNLWLNVYSQLAEICIDTRPAVRKSAGQTLFSTMELHGQLLQLESWSQLLWKVLFPLLEKVKNLCAVAPEKRSNKNLLMHHTRDTAAKQWAETQVLTLEGVAKIFNKMQHIFLKLDDFPAAWQLLLDTIENAALLPNQEISENALCSLKTILSVDCDDWSNTSRTQHLTNDNKTEGLSWCLWNTWIRIGQQSTRLAQPSQLKQHLKLLATATNNTASSNPPTSNADKNQLIPTQRFLTLLLELFIPMFDKLQHNFDANNFTDFKQIIQQTVVIHLIQFSSLFECSTISSLSVNTEHGYLSPLQKTSIDCINTVAKSILNENHKLNNLLGMLFSIILTFANYSTRIPSDIQKLCKIEQIPGSFISFGENCMELVVKLYCDCAQNPLVLNNCILDQIISMLYQPLAMKYNCPSQTTWMLASQFLMIVIKIGIPIAKLHVKESEKMWDILAKTLEDFLFSNQPCPSGLSLEEFQKNQELDCKFISLIKDLILSDSSGVPDSFIEELIRLLNDGTIDTSAKHYTDLDNYRSFREEFARQCFETLLEYSYFCSSSSSIVSKTTATPDNKASIVSRAAVKATLDKCHNVLSSYIQDERLSGKCPLPRSRLLEVKFVFKALCTLLGAFENTPAGRIDKSTWDQIINLYPLVIDCVSVSGAHFLKSLKEVLHKYQYLLNPK